VILQRYPSCVAPATLRGAAWQVVLGGTRNCQVQIGWSPFEDEYRGASLAPHLVQVSRSCVLVHTQGRLIRVMPLF
jgi:hypothetical protein